MDSTRVGGASRGAGAWAGGGVPHAGQVLVAAGLGVVVGALTDATGRGMPAAFSRDRAAGGIGVADKEARAHMALVHRLLVVAGRLAGLADGRVGVASCAGVGVAGSSEPDAVLGRARSLGGEARASGGGARVGVDVPVAVHVGTLRLG